MKQNLPNIIVRSENELGRALQRARKLSDLTQVNLADRVRIKQSTISSLENGNPGTTLRTLMLVLSAMDLELVLRARSGSDDIDWDNAQ
jgi:HTH-type transcriptional regulator / antitoxin HipB